MISGKVEGVDHVLARSDGVGRLHIHGVITTQEGDLTSIEATGYGTPTEEEGRYALNEAVTFQTAAENLTWLNKTLATGRGYADTNNGQLSIKVFMPFQQEE